MFTLYRDAIEYKDTGSVYKVLSAEAYTKEGLNPSPLVIFDEVHAQPNRELWDVMSLAGGARSDSLLFGITTAGVKTQTDGQDSLCYSLYQYGQQLVKGELEDPSFFFAWWEPKNVEADHRELSNHHFDKCKDIIYFLGFLQNCFYHQISNHYMWFPRKVHKRFEYVL